MSYNTCKIWLELRFKICVSKQDYIYYFYIDFALFIELTLKN